MVSVLGLVAAEDAEDAEDAEEEFDVEQAEMPAIRRAAAPSAAE
jgi:hypothetical protein